MVVPLRVARHGDEVERHAALNGADQVGQEDERALEHADHVDVAVQLSRRTSAAISRMRAWMSSPAMSGLTSLDMAVEGNTADS